MKSNIESSGSQKTKRFKIYEFASRGHSRSNLQSRKVGSIAKRHEFLILDYLNTHARGTADQIAKHISSSGRSMDSVMVLQGLGRLVVSQKVIDSRETVPAGDKRASIVWILSGGTI